MRDDDAHEVAKINWEAAKRGFLSLWTIYKTPKDFPDGFIARRFEHDAPTYDVLTGELEDLRDTLSRAGLVKLDRDPADPPQIVETWL
jgi:hypothetical protein